LQYGPDGVDGQDGARRENAGQLGGQEAVGDRVVGDLPGRAGAGVPPRAGREELADVDDDPGRALVEADAAEGVVELVAEEHARHPEGLDLVQAAVDVGPGAAGDAEGLLAAERLGHLDAEDDGELARPDDVGRLLGARDDAVPALAGAAVLPVDEGLEVVGGLGLATHRVHVVARVAARGRDDRLDRAHARVGDEVVDHDPLAAAPGPLDPPVVHLLVGQRDGRGPVGEGRPADHVVGRERVAALLGVGEVLDEGGAAVAPVARAVLERRGDPGLVPRLAADRVAAEAEVAEHVRVAVDEAPDPTVGAHPGERLAAHVDLAVGHLRADRLPPRGGGPGARRTEAGDCDRDDGGERDEEAGHGTRRHRLLHRRRGFAYRR
jgi:hypothetical protein